MSQKFGTPIDLRGNVIKNAGLDVVSALPTTFLVEGREVIFQGEVFRYLNGEWRINSFSAYSLKTYAELKALKDNNALVTGSLYVLTDFYTTFLAEDGETWLGSPDCEVIDHLGNPIVSDNYHILLQAISENTFSPQAYIFNQPDSDKAYLKRMSEWVIYFDLDLDLFGRIYYMHDTVYNNKFDFDIFNIRWGWKGYIIGKYFQSADISLLGKDIEPFDTYYLWTIGDIGGCYQSKYDIYNIAKDLVQAGRTGVFNVKILSCNKVFLYVQGQTDPLLTNYNYYKSCAYNVKISSSTNIAIGYESFNYTIEGSKDLYLTYTFTSSQIIRAVSIFVINGRSRGVNIGEMGSNDIESSYLTFYFPGSAFVAHHIICGDYCTFLAKRNAFCINQKRSSCWPALVCATVISRNMSGIGGVNCILNVDTIDSAELTFSDSSEYICVSSRGIYERKLATPINIPTIPIEEPGANNENSYEIETSENKTFLNYVNPNNEVVRTTLTNAEVIDSFRATFYEEFIQTLNKIHFIPIGIANAYPDAWGYEIEGVKYPTNTIFPVLCCFFCNSGTNTTTFAGKRLKFYIDESNETFYSSEYTINSNGTLTKVS